MLSISFDIGTALRHFSLIFGLTILSFTIVALLIPWYYKLIVKYGIRKELREETADGRLANIFRKLHKDKQGTPTMGGVLIWFVVAVIIFTSPLAPSFGLARFSLLNRNETYLPLFTLLATALLGLFDDYLNIRGVGNKGIRVKPKFLWLTLFAVLGGFWFHFKLNYDLIHLPGFGDVNIGAWYIVLFTFIIVATANAVNITDGLDGLAGGLVVIAFTAFGLIAYIQGLVILAAFCALVVGATLAFLWFNIPPALFYMGDTGALALGATMGVIAMVTNSIVILPFVAFVFVLEAASSLIQLTSKKCLGKKVFLIAPLHHHFEERGWSEEKVVMRFWIIGGFMAVLGVILEFLSLLSGGG